MARKFTLTHTLLAVIILLGVLFRLWVSQPTWIHWDENYYINIFQNFADRGELTPYMWRMESDTNIIAGAGTGYGIFIQIGWMALFGDSLFAMRMLMVIAGLVTAWVYYLLSKTWWQSKDAGAAAMVFGLVSTSSFYSLTGRMDAIGMLAYSLLLLLHIKAVRQEKQWPHFWVGAAAILTTEFHVLGLMYVGALAVYYGVRYLQILIRARRLVLNVYPVYYFLGAGLFGIFYVIVHILPDPTAYFLIPSSCDICLGSIWQNLPAFLSKIITQRPIEFLLLIIVLYGAVKNRKSNKHQHFLIVLMGYFITHAVVNPPVWIQYYYPFIPLLSVGLGGYFSRVIFNSDQARRQLLTNLFLSASLLMLLLNLAYFQTNRLPFENAYPIPDTPEIQYIQDHIPESTVVISSVYYFYPLKEYRNFLDYRKQIWYGLTLRNESLEAFLDRMDPQVIYLQQSTYDRDLVLQQFVEARDFVRVTPDLWVARALYSGE